MRVACLIQARLTSTRLPGKVLLKIGEHEVLWHVYQRCHSLLPTEAIGIIIPYGSANEPLAHWCAERDIMALAGPEDDVLSRYAVAAAAIGFVGDQDCIIRVTADCPFLAPASLRAMLDYANQQSSVPFHVDVLSGPQGVSAECLQAQTLCAIAAYPHLTQYDREHVTPYLRRRKALGESLIPGGDSSFVPPEDWNDWRWVLDTPEDYAWFQEIAKHVNTEPPHPTTEELCALFARRPDLIRRNPV